MRLWAWMSLPGAVKTQFLIPGAWGELGLAFQQAPRCHHCSRTRGSTALGWAACAWPLASRLGGTGRPTAGSSFLAPQTPGCCRGKQVFLGFLVSAVCLSSPSSLLELRATVHRQTQSPVRARIALPAPTGPGPRVLPRGVPSGGLPLDTTGPGSSRSEPRGGCGPARPAATARRERPLLREESCGAGLRELRGGLAGVGLGPAPSATTA